MKHSNGILIISLIAILMFSSGCFAQFTAQLVPAETVIKGTSEISASVGFYDDLNTLVGAYRRGIGGYTDATLKIGFADRDRGNDDGLILGGDFRYQVMELRIQDPVDLSVGGLVETIVGIDNEIFSLGGYVVGSRNVKLTETQDIWPYGRLTLRWDHTDFDDDFDIGFNAGAYMELNESTGVSAEFRFDQFGFILGAVFGL